MDKESLDKLVSKEIPKPKKAGKVYSLITKSPALSSIYVKIVNLTYLLPRI
jgi:hypothetical protein